MSNTPKYTDVELAEEAEKKLQEQRRQRAAIEAKKRREAEERRRQEQLFHLQEQTKQSVNAFLERLLSERGSLLSKDATQLAAACRNLLKQLDRQPDENNLEQVSSNLATLNDELTAAHKRWRQNQVKQQRVRLSTIEQELSAFEEDFTKFSPTHLRSIKQMLSDVKSVSIRDQSQKIDQQLDQLEQALEEGVSIISKRKQMWKQAKAQAGRTLRELSMLITGIASDPIIRRWQAAGIAELNSLHPQAQQAEQAEEWERVQSLSASIRTIAAQLITQANSAQLAADRRDEIAHRISNALGEMGFYRNGITLEAKSQPDSSATFLAKTSSGNTIEIFVPIEGPVRIVSGGYAFASLRTTDGKSTRTCEELESVLNKMRDRLDRDSVRTSELYWEGKPQDKARRADALPSKSNRSRV